MHGLFDVIDTVWDNWFFSDRGLGNWDCFRGYLRLRGDDGASLVFAGFGLLLGKRLFSLSMADVQFGLRGGMGRVGDFAAFMNIFFILVVKDIHELLKDFLVFGVNTHIDILIVLFQSFIFALSGSILGCSFVGGGRDRAHIPAISFNISSRFAGIVSANDLSIAALTILDLGVGMHDVGFEQIGDFPDVYGFEFLSVRAAVDVEIEVEEIFSAVVLIHADVFELELYFDVVVGEEVRKFDQLVSEIFNKLIVDVGDPGLQFDGDVLKHKMDAFLFLQHRLYFYHVLIFQFPENAHLLKQIILLLQTQLVYFSDQNPRGFGGDLLALAEGVVVLHGHDDLFGHVFL